MAKNILRPFQGDLVALQAFLFFRSPTRKHGAWEGRCRTGFSRTEYVRLAVWMLAEVRRLPCDCNKLPHRENCARVRAAEWEALFFSRWGITIETRADEGLPAQILALGGHDETSKVAGGSVIPFPVRRSG
jgi:hypothetical protein